MFADFYPRSLYNWSHPELCSIEAVSPHEARRLGWKFTIFSATLPFHIMEMLPQCFDMLFLGYTYFSAAVLCLIGNVIYSFIEHAHCMSHENT